MRGGKKKKRDMKQESRSVEEQVYSQFFYQVKLPAPDIALKTYDIMKRFTLVQLTQKGATDLLSA